MAKAKCLICGVELDTATAYKVEIVGPRTGKITHKYCCSYEEFEAAEARKKKAKEDKDNVYWLICDLFGYEIQHTQLFSEWKLWNKLKSNEIIYKYLVENKEYLRQICNKSFESEYQKIRYFSAVLKNSLRDFKPKQIVDIEQHEKTIEICGVGPTNYKPRETRRGLDFLEDE